MNLSTFIANRITFNRQKSFSRFIIRLSAVATAISVAVMIITLSFVNGFQETVSQKIFSFWGHIHVQYKQGDRSPTSEEISITKNDTVLEALKNNSQVKSIHPFATRYSILKSKDEMEGVMVKGLDSNYNFQHFNQFLQEGKWLHFNDSSYSREILISTHTANQLKLKLQDSVLIYFIRPDGTLRPDKLEIVGIYKTGIEQYDNSFAIADIKLIQRLNGWQSSQIGGYEIFLNDYHQIQQTSQELYELDVFPLEWDTKTIRDIYPNIFDWLGMQDVTRNVLIGFMLLVAVINLITCLIILVLERVRMVGVLKTLGANDWTVQKIFLRYSITITIAGIILGAALGLGLLFLQHQTGFITLKEEAYFISTAAVKIVWWQVAAVCLGTMIICFLSLMIPSFLVNKITPIKAIQFR